MTGSPLVMSTESIIQKIHFYINFTPSNDIAKEDSFPKKFSKNRPSAYYLFVILIRREK